MNAATRKRRIRWMLAIVALLIVVVAPPQVDSIDAKVRLDVARSLLWRSSIAIEPPAYHAVLAPAGIDERHYAIYPLGQTLLFLPLESAAEGLVQSARVAGWHGTEAAAVYLKDAVIAGIYLLTVNVLLALALFKLQRKLGLSSRSAAIGVLALLLCTQWLTWGRSMQEEALAALLLCTAACAGLDAARSVKLLRNALWFGACMGMLANVRYNGVFAAAALCLWTGIALSGTRNRLVFAAFSLASVAPWLCMAGWYNHARFGGVLRSGYHAAMQQGRISSWSFDVVEFSELLAGSNYGLLYFWLPAVLLFAGWRGRGVFRSGVAIVGTALILHLVFLAGIYVWARGEGCTGPRFVCHHLMLLGPFMWIGTLRIWRNWPAARPVVVAALAFSMAVQLSCVLFTGELENMQRKARLAAGLETEPEGALPLRFANVLRLADGTLSDYSYPPSLGQRNVNQFAPESFEVATRPNLTPFRVSGGIRARTSLPEWVATVAWCIWSAAAIALVACAVRFGYVLNPGSP